MSHTKHAIRLVAVALALTVAAPAQAQLKPPLPDLSGIVKDRDWALVLGKILFWDQQAGSDGQACASCHFAAGADPRTKNQLTPGFFDLTTGPYGDTAFGSERSDTGEVLPGHMPSGALAGPNYNLVPEDLPLHQLVDELDRNSSIRTTTNDRVSSQGAFDRLFIKVKRFFSMGDKCEEASNEIFHACELPARQVEPRHTPTVINAAFYHRNFWDGRANNMFCGVGVFGMRDILFNPTKRLLVLNDAQDVELGYVELENASLASQAVGPPLSRLEMSCEGRTFADIGRKMLLRRPLAAQKIHVYDSLLGEPGPFGDLRHPSGQGLKPQYIYMDLIRKAFDEKYWKALGRYVIAPDGSLHRNFAEGYTQMEHNFSLFWGIAVMLYEATLISDQSEFDSLVASGDLTTRPVAGCTGTDAVDPLLLLGCEIFFRAPFGPPIQDGDRTIQGSACTFCHAGPVFSEATFTEGGTFTPFLNPVADVNGALDIRDLGFANIGLRPVYSDLMSGGTDEYGYPLSYGRQYRWGVIVDPYLAEAIITAGAIQANIVDGTVTKLESDGSTKIPTLRNIALTAPYFSWGGYPSLRQVLKVYNRGMNRRDITELGDLDAYGSNCITGDDSGSGPDGDHLYPVTNSDCYTNTSGLIRPLGLLDCDANDVPNPDCHLYGKDVTNDDLAALERFLKSLTDRRVQCDEAPFDHPSLMVFNGHMSCDFNCDGLADDITFELPAVGAYGYDPDSGFCVANSGDLFHPGAQSRTGGPRVPLNE